MATGSDVDELDRRVRELAAHIHAATCELAGLKKIFMSKPVQKSMDAEMANLDNEKRILEGA